MCGIVGFITKESKTGEMDRARFLKQALIIDTLRGDDSTGAYGVFHDPEGDNTPYWFKALGPGSQFVDMKEYWENFADVSPYRCVVGHNRAATLGGVNVDNAHPFVEGPITLVHNGTLTSTFHLPMNMQGMEDVEVDSHCIARNLAEHPVEDVISKLNGAFALVWHDARDDSINIVRNNKRPLHFGIGYNGTLYFMSEGEMLALLDTRIKLGIKNIYFPNEGQYLKWLPDTPLDRPITKELDLFEDYWSQGYHYRQQGYSSPYGAYDWDDDEYAYPKATAHNERDDWILVGGRKKAVPMILQEAMLQYDVVTEDRWEFTPTAYGMNSQDTDRMYVAGELSPLGAKGIIYSVSPATANQTGTGKSWTVRCIGVKVSADGEPWFICRLVSTFVNPEIITKVREDAPGWDDEIPFEQVDEEEWDDAHDLPPRGMVPGPEGMYIKKSEWYGYTADGCVMCRRTVSIMDANDIIWVSEGPICPNCDDRLYEPPHSRCTYNEEGEIV